jgi:hypothetical protein
MGCLVDFYVITPKDKWLGVITVPNAHNFIRMQNALPEKFHEMFWALITQYNFIEEIIDNRDSVRFMKVCELAREYESDGVCFDSRYHHDTLLEAIRKTFYKTLYAISNDFNWLKYNYYMIVCSEEVMFKEIDQPEHEPSLQRLAA